MNNTPRQNLHGLFLLNKPVGISSNDALQVVKRLLGARKAGHAGTLDPLASGLLLLLFGEATKFSNLLVGADKVYEVTAQLGTTTTTGDAEGEVIHQKPIPPLTPEVVKEALVKFHGETLQKPPMFSALKHQGKPLYELARKNISIDIEERPIYIEYIELISLEAEHLTLRLKCSKGTYVRTLVEDIGNALGCGAHCAHLKRTAIGSYQIQNASDLSEVKQSQDPLSFLSPLSQLVSDDQKTFVSDASAYYLLRGQSIIYPWNLPENQEVLYLYLRDGQFLGMGKILPDGRLASIRLVDPSTLK